jgi:1-acyl-sn-glycerol-3-phosphate acyltransferase
MTQLDSSDKSLAPSNPMKVTTVTSRVSPWFSALAYPLARCIVLPYYFRKIEVTGRENLPSQGPVILAPTHRDRWDSFMVPIAAGRDITGRDLRFMVTSDEMRGLQGWFIRRLGGFPVDIKHPGIGSIRHAIELLQAREALVIFPEGGYLSENRKYPVNKLQPGLARIALQAESSQPGLGVKIVPINIDYSTSCASKGCDVKIRIGSPLQVADYYSKTESVKRSAPQLTADLEEALRALQLGHDSPNPKVLAASV